MTPHALDPEGHGHTVGWVVFVAEKGKMRFFQIRKPQKRRNDAKYHT